MKADRLLAITMLLLTKDSASAPDLARRFEVSVRTIYRDMESLCEAGIPVVAYPGSGGGYGIMREFKIDRSLLKPEEIGRVSAALGSLSSVVGDERMSEVADRLKAIAPKGKVAGMALPENYLFIELSPVDRDRKKIGTLRRAIEERRVARFAYVDSYGARSQRQAEPAALVFTWHSWYLYAWCRSRKDFRLFKIARISELELQAERFVQRATDLDSRPWNKGWNEESPSFPSLIRFADGVRIKEHFAPEDIELEPSGSALVRAYFPIEDWTVSYLIGLGQAFAVLEPDDLRRLVSERARAILSDNA